MELKATSNPNEGLCALCGNMGKLTFEHVPPQCAFNNKMIYVQSHEHLSDEKSLLFGKKKKSQKGFGKQSLCASCNNNTGNWYVKDFCEFTEQGLKILKASQALPIVSGQYTIKPFNVLKQILMMFISADTSGELRSHEGIVEYLMDRENVNFPKNINIFIYSNYSRTKRMLGYLRVFEPGFNGVYQWSEINYQPFGYFLTYNSPPPNDMMVNITSWKDSAHNAKRLVNLTTAYLEVSTLLIGTYDNYKG